MKLIKEFIIKEIILLILSLVIIELFIVYILLKRSGIIYEETYKETVDKILSKTLEASKKFEDFTKNYLAKYIADLKIISMHSTLFNLKTTEENSKLNNEDKKIYFATLEEMNKENIFNDFISDNENSYINKYEEEFENITDTNILLNSLFNNTKHPELNSIGYYNPISGKNDLSDEEEANIKNMISIFKSTFIKRYIIKRNSLDFIRFFIFNKEKLFIYPPTPYNLTSSYFFNYINTDAKCDENNPFPLCYFNYFHDSFYNPAAKIIGKKINQDINPNSINFLTIIKEKMHLQNSYGSVCLRMRYMKEQISLDVEPPVVCVEIDFSKLFKTSYFSDLEKYDFGMFTIEQGRIFPIINIDDNIYEIIVEQFNNSEFKNHQLFSVGNCKLFTFFHFFYYNLSLSLQNIDGLNVDWNEIDKEYDEAEKKILAKLEEYNKANSENMSYVTVDFNKTICQKKLLERGYEIVKDEFKIIVVPVSFAIQLLNSTNYIETDITLRKNIDIYIYSIISTNPKLNKEKLTTIMRIKTIRIMLFYILMSFIVLALYLLAISLISQYSLNPIYEIRNQLQKLEITMGYNKNFILEQDKIKAPNKEIAELKEIYEFMRKILIIKNAFEKENYLKKHNVEFYNLTKDIKKKDIKEVCTSFLGFYHFKNESYSLAESEFHSTILCLQERENQIISGKNEYDDKIKDSIKRSSSESYINEYSTFEKIDENILLVIKIKILRQRFIYLYAMTKFQLGMEIARSKNQDGGIIDKKKAKRELDKKVNYFKDAINYFNECKKINNMLGINQIKVIYILIMVSKCYAQLNDYRQAMNNINEALSLFLELSKSFKDYHSKNYNPRIMLFIENNIFHYILYTISRICNQFNKPNACNWINLKLFETSPFIIGNIHYRSGLTIQAYLEKKTLKLTKSELKTIKGIATKQIEKTKRYFSKLIPRINAKYLNLNKKSFLNEKMLTDASHSTSFRTKSEDKTSKSNMSSNLRKDYQTGKSSFFVNVKRNINKIITLCLSEKIFKKVNGMELKDVIIKYFQKYFVLNENDKFSFIQFANNGKKTVYFKMEQLDSFLLKIQKAKNSFEMTDTYVTNSNVPFMELYNIFDSIIKSYPPNEENLTDNIILMFINADDIRFQSIGDCIKIVEDLKKKNTSVFLLSYDDEIEPDKINNIHSFLNGFFEGYFFQIKNYQQLKQIFINISNIKYQSNFFGYDFDIFDHTL